MCLFQDRQAQEGKARETVAAVEARLTAQMQRQKAALDAVKAENERLRYRRNAS